MAQEKRFEAIVAQWGTPNLNGQVLGYQGAKQLFQWLQQQKTVALVSSAFQVTDVRMEGDEVRGKVFATFYNPSTVQLWGGGERTMMHPDWFSMCEKIRDTLYHQGNMNEHQFNVDGSEVSGFVVTPRNDGGFGIYYVHGQPVPLSLLDSTTREKLAVYRAILAKHDIRTSLHAPVADNAQPWLLYQPLQKAPTRVRELVASRG